MEITNQPKMISKNGQPIELEQEVLSNAIYQALKLADNPDRFLALNISDKVLRRISVCKKNSKHITYEDIHDITEFVLIETGNYKVAKEYANSKDLIESYFE